MINYRPAGQFCQAQTDEKKNRRARQKTRCVLALKKNLLEQIDTDSGTNEIGNDRLQPAELRTFTDLTDTEIVSVVKNWRCVNCLLASLEEERKTLLVWFFVFWFHALNIKPLSSDSCVK